MADTLAKSCGDVDVEAGRAPTQLGWYRFAQRFVVGRSVLDVGCGLGHGMEILRDYATGVDGQDLDPRLAGPNRVIAPLNRIADKSYDVIVSIDVIEHVIDPVEFLCDCTRIARWGCFLSTPNWTASRCQWPYHLREYTPQQFYRLLAPYGRIELFKGSCSGDEVFRIANPWFHFRYNDFRNLSATCQLTRVINRLLPPRLRIHSSNAAWIELLAT